MGKWVEVIDVTRSASNVAAEILESRLKLVRQRLPLAANSYRDDVEHVHQLRVNCRRTAAALQAFHPLLKSKSKRLSKWLRKIRRAAGPARDLDVLISRLEGEECASAHQEYVIARLARQRELVQPALVDVAIEEEQGGLEQSLERCLRVLHKQAKQSDAVRFDQFARRALRSVSQELFQRASVQNPTVGQLHKLRIAGKRLRYSIELFHSAFPTALREDVYPTITEIQEHLGQLNDHATAQALFQVWLADMPPTKQAAQLAKRIVKEYDDAKRIQHDFLAWWSPNRVAALESELSALVHAELTHGK